MLRHAEGLRQMYDKNAIYKKNRTTELPQKLRQSYDKMYDSSLGPCMNSYKSSRYVFVKTHTEHYN